MMHRLLRRARGQTLVLFSLMMLFLTLLVCLTLSTGAKVKEKMEVQAAADAAAYSNAVTTARVFNETALLQRAQIGNLVAMSSVQALTSWTGFWRTQINNTRNAYYVALAPYIAILVCCALPVPEPFCKPMCACAAKAVKDIVKTASELNKFNRELNNDWDSPDQKAGKQLRDLQSTAASIWSRNQKLRDTYLDLQLGMNRPANSVVDKAKGSGARADEWSAPMMGVAVKNKGEANVLQSDPQQGNHHRLAGHGSRGYTFTTNRALGGVTLTARMMVWITQKGYLPDIVVLTNDGNGYWSNGVNHGRRSTTVYGMADDHGSSFITFLRMQPPCIPSAGVYWSSERDTYLRATDQQDNSDAHVFKGGRRDSEPARTRHTLGTCDRSRRPNNCPGMWVGFTDYDKDRLIDQTNYYGQPSNLAVIQRDYEKRGTRADPWNLMFRFRFTSQNPDNQVDLRGLKLADGTDISKQTGVSAGIAYYHRGGTWKEPPNFLNPFWRATLVPLSLDNSSGGLSGVLAGSGATFAGEAWMSLQMAGFKDYERTQ